MWFNEGVTSSREFTKPILRHKSGCEHKDHESVQCWNSELINDLELVKKAEMKFAEIESKAMSQLSEIVQQL